MLDARIRKRLPGFTLDVVLHTESPIVALVGPSGSGKTLTLRAIAGALRPDEGHISLQGAVLFDSQSRLDLRPQDRQVGYVPQQYALFPHLDVRSNIGFGLASLSKSERSSRLLELLQIGDLEAIADLRPHQLSGGQQQRVALLRALAVRPRLLLLDEPFAALDTDLKASLRHEILRLQQALQFNALLVTHDPEDARVLAKETFHYAEGRIAQKSHSVDSKACDPR